MSSRQFPCRLDSNYDGDTFKLEIDLGFMFRYFAAVRLAGVDTPELRGGTQMTKNLAKLARDKAEDFILGGSVIVFNCEVWGGKYGRPIGDIIVDRNSLVSYLIEERLGVAYNGGDRGPLVAQHTANANALVAEGKL